MAKKTSRRILPYLFAATLIFLSTSSTFAQKSSRGFQGNWNWAIYAEDKSELPPAYQSMELKEVPRYALDLTLKQKGNQVSGTWGLLARFLARVDEGSFKAIIKSNVITVRLKSNFGGSATIQMTLRGNSLYWKRLNYKGEIYFPEAEVLRRLKPGEKLPYVADDDN